MPPSDDILDHESKVFNAGYDDLYSFLHIDEIREKNNKLKTRQEKKFLIPSKMKSVLLNPVETKISFKEKNQEEEKFENEIDLIKKSLV